MELHHIDPYVQAQIYKLAASGLCSGLAGQVMTSLMVKPPRPGDASYKSFVAEEKVWFVSNISIVHIFHAVIVPISIPSTIC